MQESIDEQCMMLISREIAQPNKNTFTIKPIKRFIEKYRKGVVVEPFPYPFTEDALQYLKRLPDGQADVILLDAPYSQRQLKEVYENIGGYHYQMDASYWSNINAECWRILKPGGVCLKFGWNSSKINHMAEIIDGMIVCHGGMHNDTIITVQKKVNLTLIPDTMSLE